MLDEDWLEKNVLSQTGLFWLLFGSRSHRCLWQLAAQRWLQIQLITSFLQMTALRWVLVPSRDQSPVSTLSSSESLTADAAQFPGYCTLLFDTKNVNHHEAFLELSGHNLSFTLNTKQSYIFYCMSGHLGVSVFLQKMLGFNISHTITEACLPLYFK